MDLITLIKIIILGIVEGITEWLPISSTGHMIILESWFDLSSSLGKEFFDMFLVVVQLGAIFAVISSFFKELWPFGENKTKQEKKEIWKTWLNILIACLPAGIIGVLFNDLLDKYLYNFITVAITLIVYGIVFILVEYLFKKNNTQFKITDIKQMTIKTSLIIGCCQLLALIPGTSRSGVTIIGGMLIGCNRYVSTKFSFFVSIPVMVGASLFKIFKFATSGANITSFQIDYLIIGMIVAFLVSLACIKLLTNFVKNHTFTCFGYYRIALGIVLIILFVTVLKDKNVSLSITNSLSNVLLYTRNINVIKRWNTAIIY